MRADETSAAVDLLDCTLRDGGYAIDFRFTADDTHALCRGLEEAGFRWIEIGHGVGLNGSGPEHGFAAATDEEYLKAASSALSRAAFGMFCIPGIARLSDLETARRHGMRFVRIGTNVTQSHEAQAFVVRAKSLGLTVCYNAMKSYIVTPEELLERVKPLVDAGVDVVQVVDSAGGLLPHEVRRYVQTLAAVLNVRVGFHGHNNFMLANANNLAALEAGASVVDCTLQGLGRGAGNAQTEIMVTLCEKLGYATGIDAMRTLDLGERFVRPRMAERSGISGLEVTIGQARFHSSYLPRIYLAAEAYTVDPRRLVLEVSQVDQVNPSQELILGIARRIAASHGGGNPC